MIGSFKRTSCFFILIMVIVSCAEKVIEPPENLIPKEKMTNILYDLAILNAAESTDPNALKNHHIETMPYLFEKYTIDSVQFSQSDLYYASLPLEYEGIYEAIEARLEKEKKVFDDARKEKTEKARKRADKVRDSLKKVASGKTKPPVLSKKESNSQE
ncbi:DUF4296 domain-containing protein [Croceitalea rosinachiae]|uniref:DUF4296 domain-containing protein n=1 Tax=Croceitalea rosinachiae TaxID=3075596 RepID=A0ABU3A8Z5_9FLAO|nr:DUF4296 domain-containing protein [Croceitalea sp. F388]MDT0606656.1 DUF4296 domain-containing protein [Croceitalea sp. F388]